MFLALLLAARTVMGGLDFCASFYEDFDDLWDDDAWWYYLDDAWWYYLDDASWYYVDDAWWYYFRNNTSHNETALWYYYLDDGSNVTNSYGFDEGYDYGYNDLGDYVGYDDFGYDEHFYDNYGYYKGRRRLEESYDSWMCGYYDDGGSSTCDGTVGDEDDCASGTSSVLLKIADAYGDGWDGACWSISPGGYGGGISCMDCEEPCCTMNYTLCLDSDVEYEFSVGGGSYDDEIVWQLGSWTGTGAADASFTVDMLEYPSTVAPTAFVSTIVTSVVMNLSSSDIVFFTHTFDASASSSSEVAEITNVEALLQPGASNVSFDFTFYLFNNDTLIERETATGGLLVLHAKELTKRELRTAVQPYVMGSATTTFDKGVGFLSGSGLSFNGEAQYLPVEPGDRGALFNVRICLPSELSFPESNADDELSLTLALDFAYCIPGQHETSESCDACDSGKYSFETSEECKDCPSHAQCPHKGHQGHNAGYSVNVRKGYWRDSATSTNVRLCVYQSYCDSPRATLVETKRDSDNSNLSVVFSDGSGGGTSSADEQCTHHHKGPLCALCEHGFGIQSTTGECVKCSTTSWKIAVALGGLLFLFFAGALCRLQLWSVESAETLRDGIEEAEEKVQDAAQEVSGSLKRMRAIIKHIGTLQKHLAPLVTVGFKVCISIIGNYRFAFPSIYYPRVPNISFAFLNSLSFNLGNLASSVCLVTTNYYGHLLLMTLGPLGALVAGAAYTYIAHRDRFDVFLTYALWGSYLLYTSCATTILRTFNCDSDFDKNGEGNTPSFLRSDYSVSCNTSTYTLFAVYAWIMVFLIIVGCPAAYFLALFHVRRELNPNALKEAEEFVHKYNLENQNAARLFTSSLLARTSKQDVYSLGTNEKFEVVSPIYQQSHPAEETSNAVESATEGLRRRASASAPTARNSASSSDAPKTLHPSQAFDVDAAMRERLFHLSIMMLNTADELKEARVHLGMLVAEKEEKIRELSHYPTMTRRFLSLFVVGVIFLDATDEPELKEWLEDMEQKIDALENAISHLETTLESQGDLFAIAAREHTAFINPEREAQLRSLSFLYLAYENRCWYWEVVETIRRLCLTGILVFTDQDRVSSLFTPLFIALAFLVLYGYYRPYVDENVDSFSTKAQLVVIITLFLSLVLFVDPRMEDQASRSDYNHVVIGALMVAITLLLPISEYSIAQDVRFAQDLIRFCFLKKAARHINTRGNRKKETELPAVEMGAPTAV